MALLKAQEVRQMSAEERQKRLTELRGQLMNERGIAAMGGSPPSPGKIRQLRTAIARILTIQNQERSPNGIQWAQGETPKASVPAPKPTKKARAPKPINRPHSAQGRVHAKRSHAENRAAARAAASKPKAAHSAPKPASPKRAAQAKSAKNAAAKKTKKEA
jgi:large subunit ribosomal protein L29